MQIQQGMERLRTVSPEVFQSMGFPQLPPNLVPPAAVPPTSAAPAAAPASTTNPASPGSAPATGSTPVAPAPGALPGNFIGGNFFPLNCKCSILAFNQRTIDTR